jgi:hypothetical protein
VGIGIGIEITSLTVTARTLADDCRSGVKWQQLVTTPLESYDKLGKEGNNQSSKVALRTTNRKISRWRNMSKERKKLPNVASQKRANETHSVSNFPIGLTSNHTTAGTLCSCKGSHWSSSHWKLIFRTPLSTYECNEVSLSTRAPTEARCD